MKDRIIIAITGATGIIYGIRLLEELRKLDAVDSLLILSDWAKQIILEETSFSVEDVESLGHKIYSNQDLAAPIASGSYQIKAMVVVPCSMKTLAGISSGFSNSLILRAADVSLKEHRKLVLVPRETPLNQVHIRNMLTLASMGAVITPPMPAFYTKPASIDDLVNHHVARILNILEYTSTCGKRWKVE